MRAEGRRLRHFSYHYQYFLTCRHSLRAVEQHWIVQDVATKTCTFQDDNTGQLVEHQRKVENLIGLFLHTPLHQPTMKEDVAHLQGIFVVRLQCITSFLQWPCQRVGISGVVHRIYLLSKNVRTFFAYLLLTRLVFHVLGYYVIQVGFHLAPQLIVWNGFGTRHGMC